MKWNHRKLKIRSFHNMKEAYWYLRLLLEIFKFKNRSPLVGAKNENGFPSFMMLTICMQPCPCPSIPRKRIIFTDDNLCIFFSLKGEGDSTEAPTASGDSIYTSETRGSDEAGEGSYKVPYKTILQAMRRYGKEPFPVIYQARHSLQ